ncbi:13639_t:CDS:2, partial [Racocetra persica]
MSDVENDQQNLNGENTEDLLFDPSLKKKKKKPKVVFEDQVETKEEKPTENANNSNNSEKVEEEVPVESTELEQPKPKKKKKKIDFADFERQLKEVDEDESRGAEDDKEDNIFVPEGEQVEKETKVEETWLKSDRDYTYQELLGRVFRILRQNNPELAGDKKRYTIVPPSVHREGNKKTIFANVSDICKRMHRQPEHVIQFLFAELGTSGSIDGSQRLVIRGRFVQKQIENVLRRYIGESRSIFLQGK